MCLPQHQNSSLGFSLRAEPLLIRRPVSSNGNKAGISFCSRSIMRAPVEKGRNGGVLAVSHAAPVLGVLVSPCGSEVCHSHSLTRGWRSLRCETHKRLGTSLGPVSPAEYLTSLPHCRLTVIMSLPRGTTDHRVGLPPSLQMHLAMTHCCFLSSVTKQSGLNV